MTEVRRRVKDGSRAMVELHFQRRHSHRYVSATQRSYVSDTWHCRTYDLAGQTFEHELVGPRLAVLAWIRKAEKVLVADGYHLDAVTTIRRIQ